MGSPPNEPERENQSSRVQENQVAVTLTHGFWIARYELTQAAWESVMHTTLQEQRLKALTADSNSVGPDFPIFCVNYDESLEFCDKLTKQERDAGRLPENWVYRLPTEAQWEYACRAGTTTATHYGSSLSSAEAHILGDKPYNKGKPGPRLLEEKKVGQYKPNAWGLYDMHGNFAEWCLDSHVKSPPRRNRSAGHGRHTFGRPSRWQLLQQGQRLPLGCSRV
jgi:formylglycine-generating enzyme required for sulfatase activity